MTGRRLLILAGLDPSGRAGLARDLAAAEAERVDAAPIVTALTVQPRRGAPSVHPTDPALLRKSLAAAQEAGGLAAIKVGLVPTARLAREIASFQLRTRLPLVLDPVLADAAGRPLVDEAVVPALRDLCACARMVTPNRPELQRLTGRPTSTDQETRAAAAWLRRTAHIPWVLAKGGHAGASTVRDFLVGPREAAWEAPRLDLRAAGVGRGKGCELATRIAAGLAKGLEPAVAARVAVQRVQARLEHEATLARAPARTRRALAEYETVLERLLADLEPSCVPEVGMNVAYAPRHATGPHDVVGLAGRVTIAGDRFAVTGRPTPQGPHHTGRLAWGARAATGRAVWVLNHRYDPTLAAAAPDHVALDRRDEPRVAPSSMEWMLAAALSRAGGLPAFVSDPGMPGKEAMIRVFAHDGTDLVRHHRALHALRGGAPSLKPVLVPARRAKKPRAPG